MASWATAAVAFAVLAAGDPQVLPFVPPQFFSPPGRSQPQATALQVSTFDLSDIGKAAPSEHFATAADRQACAASFPQDRYDPPNADAAGKLLVEMLKELRRAGGVCPDGQGGLVSYPRNTGPFDFDCRLYYAARRHGRDMVRTSFFGPVGSDGSTSCSRTNDEGFQACVQDLAAGSNDAQYVLDAWRLDPRACSHILNPAVNRVGVAHVKGTSCNQFRDYWVIVLGSTDGPQANNCLQPAPKCEDLEPTFCADHYGALRGQSACTAYWPQAYCARTCGYCKDPEPTPMPVPDEATCQDDVDPAWCSRQNLKVGSSECLSHAAYEKCQRTCKLCPIADSVCLDGRPEVCAQFAPGAERHHECGEHSVQESCRKTCRECPSKDALPLYCRYWEGYKGKQECQSDWLKIYCRKTCGLCDEWVPMVRQGVQVQPPQVPLQEALLS